MPTSPMTVVIQHLRSALLRDGADLTDAQLLTCFVSRREAAALEALVRRHASMVWGVCCRIMGNPHDAEDAFQATFLVLLRKAASIHPRAKLGNWLYGVARQTALKGRATRAKRRMRERQVTEMPEPAATEQNHGSDLQPLLDQELSRLPEKYRTVIVLCELEGKTGRQAARQLGLPQGTVASRLARAKTLLARRLSRHGLAVTGPTLAGVLSHEAASASAPTLVLTATIKAVTSAAAGQAAAGVISVKVAALAEGVLKTMLMTKLKITSLALLLGSMVVLTWGAFAAQQPSRLADEVKGNPPIANQGNGRGAVFDDKAMNLPRLDVNGDPLPPGAVNRIGSHRFRHRGLVTHMAYTPDGKGLVSTSYYPDDLDKGDLNYWDAATGKLRWRLPVPWLGYDPVLAVSSDGKKIAVINQFQRNGLYGPIAALVVSNAGRELIRHEWSIKRNINWTAPLS